MRSQVSPRRHHATTVSAPRTPMNPGPKTVPSSKSSPPPKSSPLTASQRKRWSLVYDYSIISQILFWCTLKYYAIFTSLTPTIVIFIDWTNRFRRIQSAECASSWMSAWARMTPDNSLCMMVKVPPRPPENSAKSIISLQRCLESCTRIWLWRSNYWRSSSTAYLQNHSRNMNIGIDSKLTSTLTTKFNIAIVSRTYIYPESITPSAWEMAWSICSIIDCLPFNLNLNLTYINFWIKQIVIQLFLT